MTKSANISAAIAWAIREARSVPSGHLYAVVQGHVDLSTYQSIIRSLVAAQLITDRGHLLTWIGPR